MLTVLIQRGKEHETHIVSVKTFLTKTEAENFCKESQSIGKYWVYAKIIDEGELIELGNPWFESN